MQHASLHFRSNIQRHVSNDLAQETWAPTIASNEEMNSALLPQTSSATLLGSPWCGFRAFCRHATKCWNVPVNPMTIRNADQKPCELIAATTPRAHLPTFALYYNKLIESNLWLSCLSLAPLFSTRGGWRSWCLSKFCQVAAWT